jgi:hypothetical protein
VGSSVWYRREKSGYKALKYCALAVTHCRVPSSIVVVVCVNGCNFESQVCESAVAGKTRLESDSSGWWSMHRYINTTPKATKHIKVLFTIIHSIDSANPIFNSISFILYP